MKIARQNMINVESIFSRDPQSIQEAYIKTRPAKAKSLWEFLKSYIPFHENMVVLSPGSSYAIYESEFSKLAKCHVIASDIDRDAVHQFQHDNISKIVADAVNPPFKNETIDVIILPPSSRTYS